MSEALLFDIDELNSIDTLKPKIEVFVIFYKKNWGVVNEH